MSPSQNKSLAQGFTSKKFEEERNEAPEQNGKSGMNEREMINNSGTMKLQQKTPFEQYTYYTYFTDDKN